MERRVEDAHPLIDRILDRLFKGKSRMKSVMGSFERSDVHAEVVRLPGNPPGADILVELKNSQGEDFALGFEKHKSTPGGVLFGDDGQQIELDKEEVRTLYEIAKLEDIEDSKNT